MELASNPPCGRNEFCGLCYRLPELWSRIEHTTTLVQYAARRRLFEEGGPSKHVIAVCSGAVRLHAHRANGGQIIFRIAHTGDC